MNLPNHHTHQLAAHFFRHSYARTVAILVRYFGLDQVEVAEDIVQDTLVEAVEKWSIHGIPDNPDGWIMDVAKKKTINLLKRKQLFATKVVPQLQDVESAEALVADSTLRMIFACCHPALPTESQIALALKTLCGLSIPEIAKALLTSEDNINKRLYRAKKKLREEKIAYDIPVATSLNDRLDSVCKTLYLLFNEGYYAPHHKEVLRIDLCYEAVRLLKEVEETFHNSAKVNGLLALMMFSLSRFESRLDKDDSLICLQDQNRSLWDKDLIAQGMNYLTKAIRTKEINTYQLQAGIAAEHCMSPDFASTNWQSIYQQYTILESLDSSFLVKMNRLIAYFYLGHKTEALTAMHALEHSQGFAQNTSYYMTLGTLYLNMQDDDNARYNLKEALIFAKNEREKDLIQTRLASIDSI
ncbi:sigma-70 family RNA polymerase sigma factor [Fulvivirga lutimaris]|uniref:sigma-70 family RNA polymerase sigma factor n=1 Tax=Fulvivirga lutimaris TaxID=1819566 RepID=UPI0012BBC811|nr:sigma-70 family RNA polymerase sigma factor [Fulvivirga lutimaris]